MNRKPKLIDEEFLKKISIGITKDDIKKDVSSNLETVFSKYIVTFLTNYCDLIMVLLILSIILYVRYQFVLKEKEKNKNPDFLEVNYHRNNDYEEGSIVNTNDKIETSRNVGDDLMDMIKSKVNNFDNELEPVNMTSLNNYESI